MKKSFILLIISIFSFYSCSFATDVMSEKINSLENEYSINNEYNSDELYFNSFENEEEYLYDEYENYSNEYESNFESLSLSGKVIEASEVFTYDNGYVKYLAQKVKVKIVDS